MNVTAFIYQLKVMSYQLQIESIERREKSKAEELVDSLLGTICSGICILPIPLGIVLLIAGIKIANIDDAEKDELRYILKL